MTKRIGKAQDVMGDTLKAIEMIEAGRVMIPDLPVVARLDGRAFHTFTRGMARPFDGQMSALMQKTTMELVSEFHASIGYTQSDEITLVWRKPTMFGGRFQKYHSVLAGYASAVFARAAAIMFPEKDGIVPCFDCRVFQVPNLEVAVDVLQWREEDAVKNSIQALAQAHFSHKQLQGKGRVVQLDMLKSKGINWNDCSTTQKRGVYFQRKVVESFIGDTEWASIPVKHRPPSRYVMRGKVLEVEELEHDPIKYLRHVHFTEMLYDILFPERKDD